ncbi:hypothetical protein B0H14DRAFT_3851818 [Mycena olivaceomarginata]|nr:hypothetical protein B0H14DRAFT_3851818 [Mycena olivaceomarginata]
MPLLRLPFLRPTYSPYIQTTSCTSHQYSPQSSSVLPPDATRYQRLKHLFKAYGWYALGMYLCLSVIDFGVAFSLINIIGAEYVERLTTSAKQFALGFLSSKPPEPGLDELDPAPSHGGHEGLMAMIILAYTVHKTLFLPVRVGLTAYLTPTLVGWLRQRGWAGGAGTVRAATHMRERLRSGKNKAPRGD